MTVERRLSPRCPVAFNVRVHYRKHFLTRAQAQNLSTEGLFIETTAVTLPTGILVELEFDYLGRDWLLAAITVHRGTNGVGLMFRGPQPELLILEKAVDRYVPDVSY